MRMRACSWEQLCWVVAGLGISACEPSRTTPPANPPVRVEPDPDAGGATIPVDALGRLTTAPGLCSVVGGLELDTGGFQTSLQLAYDEAGRPTLAIADTTPACADALSDSTAKRLGTELPCHRDQLTQTVEWQWAADGTLDGVDHTASWVPGPTRGDDIEEHACLVGPEPFSVERSRWKHDKNGRLVEWSQVYADCEDTEEIGGRLRYTDGGVEVERSGSGQAKTMVLGERGEVLDTGLVRYQYDASGRTIHVDRSDGTTRSWGYEHRFVAGLGGNWSSAVSADGRTIRLEQLGTDRHVDVELDDRGRPIAVARPDERWELGYGGCKNAEHATHRWALDAVFNAWPFPEPVRASQGGDELEAWSHRRLPLEPL